MVIHNDFFYWFYSNLIIVMYYFKCRKMIKCRKMNFECVTVNSYSHSDSLLKLQVSYIAHFTYAKKINKKSFSTQVEVKCILMDGYQMVQFLA